MTTSVDDLNSPEVVAAFRKRGKRKAWFHAEKTVIDGIEFDSKAEAEFYVWGKIQVQNGVITNFKKLDKKLETFELQPAFRAKNGKRIQNMAYTPDFLFEYEGVTVAIEIKGSKKAATEASRMRCKMFQFRYPEILFHLIEMKSFDPDFLIDKPKAKRVK